MELLNYYIYDLLKDAWFTEEDNLDLLGEEVKWVLYDRIISHVLWLLTFEELEQLNNIIISWTQDDVYNFIYTKVVTLNINLDEILKEFENEFLEF